MKTQKKPVFLVVPSRFELETNGLDEPLPDIYLKIPTSGGKTLIKEKPEIFNRLDVEEHLVVLMLMLPSANRQNKETLKVFKDQGGFTDFFPREDDFEGHKKLKDLVPSLDCFSTKAGIFGTPIKTSLSNALKVLRPLVVMDEGHRAYGELAKNTIRNFNPSFILE